MENQSISGRLSYKRETNTDIEPDISSVFKMTQDRGIAESGVINFCIPPDIDRFTELSSAYLECEFRVTRADGSKLTVDDKVWLDRSGIHSLFSSCSVLINGAPVSVMTNYAHTAQLSRLLGCSMNMRNDVLSDLDGSYDNLSDSSRLVELPDGLFFVPANLLELSKNVKLGGRIFSDFLMSTRQYLPPGVRMSIELRRSIDSFALCSKSDEAFRINFTSATIYLRRFKISDKIFSRISEDLKSNPVLVFNRLECRIMSVAAGTRIFHWNDIRNGGALPNRIYICMISQDALYGSYKRMSTYFESFGLSSVNLKLNGRDMLVSPIKSHYEYSPFAAMLEDKTDARDGYKSVLEILDQISNQNDHTKITYGAYIRGGTITATELGRCGLKSTGNGNIDIEVSYLLILLSALYVI